MTDKQGRPENLWAYGLDDVELRVLLMSEDEMDAAMAKMTKKPLPKIRIGKPFGKSIVEGGV